ncbi:metal-dependent hydrolase [Bacillus sp. 03113]|uniref:metal-dependent hydrolase n=1 Tax=Bacillus sp. 03113 TaxID=2578211 RepID=UPI002852EEBC|nr:metal-dependent hydrolase [Bacillus sp. 03113]
MDFLNGTAHCTIGAAAGFVVANTYHADLASTLLLVGIGGVAGLIPDIDINGKLANRITLSHKVFRSIAQFIGCLMIIYSFIQGVGTEKWLGMGIGVGMIILSSFLTQRRMLSVTGVGVLVGGLSLHENWLLLLGVYIIIASFLPHRSYTHSIIGILFFGVIASELQASLQVNGVFTTCVTGYMSHIMADMKIFPFNKRGVKLFLPLSSKEF